MKFAKTTAIIFILFVLLFVFIFLGSNVKEGITYMDISLLKTLLVNTNETNITYNMSIIKKMDIDDIEFQNIVKNEKLDDTQILTELNKFIGSKLIKKGTRGSLSDKIYEDI